MEHELVWNVAHLFSGAGGWAKGTANIAEEWLGMTGVARNMCAIDVDETACETLRRLTGCEATAMDLFTRQQYTDFHGQDPPQGWREATAEDLRRAANYETPDILCISAPCQGNSRLIGKATSELAKYRALNALSLRAFELALEAWGGGVLIVNFENVPGIEQRSDRLLRDIRALLRRHSFAVDYGRHDLGVIGGLGQHRWRYWLKGRKETQVTGHVFLPPRRPMKSLGDVIGPLPFPGDPCAGPMHRLPKLDFRTNLRLALIGARLYDTTAKHDWRDIPGPGQWRLITPDGRELPVAQIDGKKGPDTAAWGRVFIAELAPGAPGHDARLHHSPHRGSYGLGSAAGQMSAVLGSADARGSNGMVAVGDVRLGNAGPAFNDICRLADTGRATVAVTAGAGPRGGGLSVGDLRLSYVPRGGALSLADPARPIRTVSGTVAVTASNGPGAVAEARMRCAPHNGTMGVLLWSGPAGTIINSADVHAGRFAVGDEREIPLVPWPEWFPPYVILTRCANRRGEIVWIWPRPLTSLELAALQSFPITMPDGRPLEFAMSTRGGRGNNREWRRQIGNAVPCDAAEAIARADLRCLIASHQGVWMLGCGQIWVGGRSVNAVRRSIQPTGAGYGVMGSTGSHHASFRPQGAGAPELLLSPGDAERPANGRRFDASAQPHRTSTGALQTV